MQLLLRRNQRAGGFSGSMIFCLDARVEFTAQEQLSIDRYRLGSQVIYNSQASKAALDRSEASQDGSIGGSFRSLAFAALAAMKLNISIASLQRGQHVECKSLDELLGAEEAIMEACRNLRGYLGTAATFDGREVVVEFTDGQETVVAQAAPAPLLVASTVAPLVAPAAPEPTVLPPSAPLPVEPPSVAPTHEMQDGEAVPIARAAAPRLGYDPARPSKKRNSGMEPEARAMLLIMSAVALMIVLFQFFVMSR